MEIVHNLHRGFALGEEGVLAKQPQKPHQDVSALALQRVITVQCCHRHVKQLKAIEDGATETFVLGHALESLTDSEQHLIARDIIESQDWEGHHHGCSSGTKEEWQP
ncbi:hypothetical protein PI124_g14959 [Phytophthora idaei]|nr:hypothetical protein PI125_g12580 [Phytophthora idaei]KAG3146973.1 hypothetical protein PI126_g13065 [Phytophthora idaei]KAG3240143.1 hypothetical protein PI124_g14959 [Phytophthora idaei]